MKNLAGMLRISVDIGNKEWSDGVSKYYLDMERALNVKREDVKAKLRKYKN